MGNFVISHAYGSWSGYYTGNMLWKTTGHQP
jgi:hypothetical protein